MPPTSRMDVPAIDETIAQLERQLFCAGSDGNIRRKIESLRDVRLILILRKDESDPYVISEDRFRELVELRARLKRWRYVEMRRHGMIDSDELADIYRWLNKFDRECRLPHQNGGVWRWAGVNPHGEGVAY